MIDRMKHAELLVVALLFTLAGCADEPAPGAGEGATPPRPARVAPVKLENARVSDGVIGVDLTVTLRNSSTTRTVRAVTFWVRVVDGHGDVVTGLGQDVARLLWQRDTIAPGATATGRWNLAWFGSAIEVEASGVCRVTFSDGTDWQAEGDDNCR